MSEKYPNETLGMKLLLKSEMQQVVLKKRRDTAELEDRPEKY